MYPKSRINTLCLALLPFFVLLVGYFLFTSRPLYALISLVGIMGCVKMRVRMGYRGPRKILFAAHMACTFTFVIALILLLVTGPSMHLWVRSLSHISFFGMVVTGALLIRQSWHPKEVTLNTETADQV